jgi:transcriptional regulator with GAF, ATPase, and Fis domain
LTPSPGSTQTYAERRAPGEVARPQLYRVIEGGEPAAAPSRHDLGELEEVTLGRGPREWQRDAKARRLALRVPDPFLSSEHVRLHRVSHRWVLDDCRSRNGTSVNGVAATRVVLRDGDRIEIGRTLFLFHLAEITTDAAPLDEGAPDGAENEGLVTLVPRLRGAMDRLRRVATSAEPIVLRAETGAGKELMARAVHGLSGRSGAFVPVNCGALPAAIVAAELFGFRRGAFSGATEDRPGLVRASHQGTLFLDEIGDLPLEQQVILLRVLQEREVMPVGATRPVPVDLRVVCASHKDLRQLVEAKAFRLDLLSRLDGFTFELPPLRERLPDFGLLVRALLVRRGGPMPTFSAAALRALVRYPWPGNVRELERCLGTAHALAGDAPIEPTHLPSSITATPSESPRPSTSPSKVRSEDDEALRRHLDAKLREHRGNLAAVARDFGKARMQIHRWLQRFDLDPDAYRDG